MKVTWSGWRFLLQSTLAGRQSTTSCGRQAYLHDYAMKNADAPALEHTAPVSDGTELFYRAWIPSGATRAVVLCHRGHEHSGRLAETAAAITPPGVAAFAWDARGHGRSPGRRGFAPGFARMVQDLDEFVHGISARHDIAMENIVVVAHSVGAVVASTWVHDYAPRIRGLVLVTPAFRVRLYVPFAIPMLRLLHWLRPEAVISSYVKAAMLTHDQEQAASYAADPLISRDISNRILLEMNDAAARVVADAGAILVPTLVLSAGRDWVVDIGVQNRFVSALSSPVKHHIVYPGMHHAILHERERHLPWAAIRDFIHARFAQDIDNRCALAAEGSVWTRCEHARLCRPLPWWSTKRWGYAVAHAALGTLGRTSASIATAWRTGFDSGESLDHVYRNRAEGASFIGRMIDRTYLNSPGWAGIRQRREHLIARITDCLRQASRGGQEVHLVDIAAGPGRYDLDALEQAQGIPATALLRDRSPGGVEAGRGLARERGLEGRVRNEVGDAFDADDLAALSPRPDVAVVSGLYELFPDNTLIRRSLAGLARAVPSGGWLVYTNQPWHPQLEFIARTLINRDGQPWIMRCRTQAEIDALVDEAGFAKTGMSIDRWGIFTVSVAQRR